MTAAWWMLANGTAPTPTGDPYRWQGAITFLVDGLSWRPTTDEGTPLFDWRTMFTAQGYDNPACYTEDDCRKSRAQFRSEGYTHWLYGPLLQKGYHGRWPDTDFRSNPEPFLARARALRADGITPVLVLLDDQGVYAAEHGGVNRDKIEAELTPLYTRPEWQTLFPIVMEAWEPQWAARDHEWVAQWMARVWPQAIRAIHLPSGKGAPGLQEDLKEKGGEFEHESDIWNLVIPSYHLYLMQETHVLQGEVEDGRTIDQQFVYDFMDKVRRMRYGHGGNAPQSGPEVEQWDSVRGSSAKKYWEWNGDYRRDSANGGPLAVLAGEYASYLIKQDTSVYPGCKRYGDLALTVEGVIGYGDSGTQAAPGRGAR